MVDPFPRRTDPPVGFRQTPKGVTGEREIKLLRLVRMVGIFGVGTEQQNAAGDPLAHEGAPLAEPFTKAVVFEEALAEIGVAIGLPPVEFAGQRRDAFDQRAGLGRRKPRQVGKRGDDRKRSAAYRPRNQLPRPVAQERVSFRYRSEQFPQRDNERAQGLFGHPRHHFLRGNGGAISLWREARTHSWFALQLVDMDIGHGFRSWGTGRFIFG